MRLRGGERNAPAAFWMMGLLNNLPYVIMLACAKSISEGGTALVFLSNTLPGLLTKLSAPFWFDKVSYSKRIAACSVLMGTSFVMVAFFTALQQSNHDGGGEDKSDGTDGDSGGDGGFYVVMQLLGVALCSAAGSLGEASLLALSGKTDSILVRVAKEREQESSPPKHGGEGACSSNSNYQGLLTEEEEEVGSSAHDEDYSEGTRTCTRSTHCNPNAHTNEPMSVCITTFSSGTGLSGVIGFAFVILFRDALQISMSGTLLCAVIIGPSYWFVYSKGLSIYANSDLNETSTSTIHEVPCGALTFSQEGEEGSFQSVQGLNGGGSHHFSIDDDASDEFQENPNILDDGGGAPDYHPVSDAMNEAHASSDVSSAGASSSSSPVGTMLSVWDRLQLVLSLWPYMIPLFSVYAAEYALQSGVWTAIGFPVEDQTARNSFYMKSNWTYQAGVFISRSTGTLFHVSLPVLWLMPVLQIVNLVVFYFIAATEFWYDYTLLLPCFYVGLLGGAVYVHGYKRINKDIPIEKREFAMSAASVADDSGVLMADLAGLFIQSCLYKVHEINGAMVTCPV